MRCRGWCLPADALRLGGSAQVGLSKISYHHLDEAIRVQVRACNPKDILLGDRSDAADIRIRVVGAKPVEPNLARWMRMG